MTRSLSHSGRLGLSCNGFRCFTNHHVERGLGSGGGPTPGACRPRLMDEVQGSGGQQVTRGKMDEPHMQSRGQGSGPPSLG